jgi:hypothetical protein
MLRYKSKHTIRPSEYMDPVTNERMICVLVAKTGPSPIHVDCSLTAAMHNAANINFDSLRRIIFDTTRLSR